MYYIFRKLLSPRISYVLHLKRADRKIVLQSFKRFLKEGKWELQRLEDHTMRRLAFETQRKLSLFRTIRSMSPLYLSSFAVLF